MNTFVTILVLIVMLGILISSHEAGHLAMAKAFGVYCEEYSIGFGPKLFSHRRKGGETAFSLRVIPLGGYVAMYSEQAIDEQKKERKEMLEKGEELPFGVSVDEDVYVNDEGKKIPRNRSLESKKWWQRIIILIAGIVVNLLLSYLFIYIYATCFPTYYGAMVTPSTGNSLRANGEDIPHTHIYNYDFKDDKPYGSLAIAVNNKDKGGNGTVIVSNLYAHVGDNKDGEQLIYSPAQVLSQYTTLNYGYYIDGDATYKAVDGKEFKVVVMYSQGKESDQISLFDNINIYKQYSEKDKALNIGETVEGTVYKNLGITYLPNIKDKISPKKGDVLIFNTALSTFDKETKSVNINKLPIKVEYNEEEKPVADKSITMYSVKSDLSYRQKVNNANHLWVNFFTMIGEGFGKLFTFNTKNMGGIISMGTGVSSLNAKLGVGKTFFFYGGFLSLNLGLFNLLPFPALDGWGIFVTIIEAIWTGCARLKYRTKHKGATKQEVDREVSPRKIPAKAKNIVSTIGFVLLIAFAIFITIKDIMRLVG